MGDPGETSNEEIQLLKTCYYSQKSYFDLLVPMVWAEFVATTNVFWQSVLLFAFINSTHKLTGCGGAFFAVQMGNF